jgi:hypothetical protein
MKNQSSNFEGKAVFPIYLVNKIVEFKNFKFDKDGTKESLIIVKTVLDER